MKSEAASARVLYLEPDEEQRLMKALDAREERIRAERDSHNAWLRERGHAKLPNLQKKPYADHLKPMVLLSMNSGMRRGKVFDLEWRDIDIRRAMLNVRAEKSKSCKGRTIPLNATVLDAFKGSRKQTGGEGLVFSSPRTGERFNDLSTPWCNLMADAEIEDFRWHDMRHHFASGLVQKGVDLNTVRELLGHGDLTMTIRYSHLSPANTWAAVDKLVTANVLPFAQSVQAKP